MKIAAAFVLTLACLIPMSCAGPATPPAQLDYTIPGSWSEDPAGAAADGLLARLGDENLSVEISYLPYPREKVADPLDTVAVEYLGEKRSRDFTFELERWRPWQIDPDRVDVIGLHGRSGHSSDCSREEHSRMLFLDDGSGAYLVTMKSTERVRLVEESCDRFLESLEVTSR